MKIFSTYIIPASFLLTISCKNVENDKYENTTLKQISRDDIVEVKVAEIRTGSFDAEIISNGKAYAINKADIKFPFSEKISSVLISNGKYVQKGQLLATLDATDLKSKLSRNKESMAKALVELDDRLIDYGYRLQDSAKIPAAIMRMARIKSGYNSAYYDYVDVTSSVRKATILAPFSGKIADVEASAFNTSDSYKKLCTLIDDSWMKIEFSLLETELKAVVKGADITVIPFGEDITLRGEVVNINPLIDENGMIKVVGRVQNAAGHLLDGMSVRVIVKNAVPDKMFIPKTAVVQRQDREVVFTYENGHARWNYVETGIQNSNFITINSGLEKDKLVIVTNNLNLAHDSKVKVDKFTAKSE